MVATSGRRLGRYHLVEPIGAGPCGEVFRAKVVGVAGMERQLAIKRFHPEVLALPDAQARLQQASRSYGGLDHPRVARLSELGVAGGETFTATELVPGLDVGKLRALAEDSGEPLSSGGVLQLVSAAARAVGYAHGRGVCHWGLAPGNLVVTPDGDIKVTDFGILTCRLPARPATDESLFGRLPYLAPEQLLGEPVAAATDVFALGVLAYELVGGARPFTGATPADLEHAIVSGRPPPLELPRPVARVIDRCLARSPFERFPDARSLADALDAALRLSPLSGARRDVGERVRLALEHLARINEQQLSGALSFSVPTPPARPPRPSLSGSLPLPLAPTAAAPPAATAPDRLPPAPRRPFKPSSSPAITVPPTGSGDEVTQARPGRLRVETDLSIGDDTGVRVEPLWPPTEPVPLVRPDGSPLSGPPRVPPAPAPSSSAAASPPGAAALPASPPAPAGRAETSEPLFAPRTVPPSDRAVAISQPPPFSGPPPPSSFSSLGPPPAPMAMQVPSTSRRRTRALAALAVVVIGGAAAAAYLVTRGQPASTAAAPPADAPALAAAEPRDAATAPSDAAPTGATATAPLDAATAAAAPVDAAAPSDAPAAAPPTDKLTITSTPPGARVFLDGADQGVTPLTVAASTDEYKLALFAPGRALHLATIPGSGTYDATLAAVPAAHGKGGIKVRCHDKQRYYIFVDGAPTGMLCPNDDRIDVELGNHTVEIYDLTTETRRTLPVLRVNKTARSTRIKAD